MDAVATKRVPIADAVAEVMAKYRATVDRNKSATWDTHRAVAFDRDGMMGVWGEVVEMASDMGYWVDDESDDVPASESVVPFVDALLNEARAYQAELRERFPNGEFVNAVCDAINGNGVQS